MMDDRILGIDPDAFIWPCALDKPILDRHGILDFRLNLFMEAQMRPLSLGVGVLGPPIGLLRH
jgi:hypothetical protein